jgi:hypothetical protein
MCQGFKENFILPVPDSNLSKGPEAKAASAENS